MITLEILLILNKGLSLMTNLSIPRVLRHMSYVLVAGLALMTIASFIPPALSAEKGATLSKEQKVEVEALIQKFIMENPRVILESVQNMERQNVQEKERRAQAVIAERSKDIFEDPNSVVGGNPKGDVTLVEFFDYQCGYCKSVHPVVRQLLSEDPNIKFVYKEFPILGPASNFAAQASIASIGQGKYLAFHNALMEVKGGLSEKIILSIASDVGLDTEILAKSIADQNAKISSIVRENHELARDLAISGTPAFVIGNQIIRGAVGIDVLKQLVADARASKKG